MALSRELLDILACPACKGKVVFDEQAATLFCPQCRLKYPVREGIPVMLVDEAEKIS